MLEKLLTSRTRVKLFTLFLMNPERGFYVREICRLTGLNVNSVRRELANLESVGLLVAKPSGNTKTYVANRKMPIYEELTSIVLKTEGVGRALKERIGEIGGIENAFVYGSFAKNEARLDSDVDVFIIGTLDEDKLVKVISEIEGRISRNVNYVLFGRSEFEERRHRNDPFVSNVMSEPRIDLIGTVP